MAPIDSKALLTVEQDAPVWKHSDKVPSTSDNTDVDVEMTWYELEYKDYILKFTLDIFGPQPKSGFAMYVGLHGGGGASDRENNSDWYFWSTYHAPSIQSRAQRPNQNDDQGNAVQFGAIYMALRFASKRENGKYDGNTWDTHFTPPAQVLIEKLIMRMLMKDPLTSNDIARYESFTQNPEATSFVDSNQIYLLGFSAGGDGVYRLSTNLADRFAAVNMSAGHPGDVQFDNLANTPICLQVGDEDDAYDRNTTTVDVAFKLDALALRFPGLYAHSCYVHVHRRSGAWAHNSWNVVESGYSRGPVLTDLHTWRINPEAGQQHQVMMNTNAVDWVSRYPRNPHPRTVVWNLRSRPPRDTELDTEWPSKRFFYWLYLRADTDETDTFEVTFERASNSFYIDRRNPKPYFGILLSQNMVDFGKEVTVFMRGHGKSKQSIGTFNVKADEEIRRQTLDARGDDKLVFDAAIHFKEMTEGDGPNKKTWWVAEAAEKLYDNQ
jgi:predicted esterase